MNNKHVMTIFAAAMLLYTGWRTLDYMSGNLLDVSQVVRAIISVAFLVFSEVGLLVWLHQAKPNATTNTQETTATVMIWVDFVGSMVVGLADLAKHNTMYNIDLSWVDPILFIAPWVMVVLNVGGYLLYHQNDSEAQQDQAERQLNHEEAKLEIEARREAIRELRNNKKAIAQKLAPHYFTDIKDRVTGRTLNRFIQQAEADESNKTVKGALPAPNQEPAGRDIPVSANGAGDYYNFIAEGDARCRYCAQALPHTKAQHWDELQVHTIKARQQQAENSNGNPTTR